MLRGGRPSTERACHLCLGQPGALAQLAAHVAGREFGLRADGVEERVDGVEVAHRPVPLASVRTLRRRSAGSASHALVGPARRSSAPMP